MQALHLIGQVSLNISTFIYFIWFIPQLILTFHRKTTHGLSLYMHTLLLMGYCADLMYGFGLHMPIQYRLVTIAGLISLLVEHYQFFYYGMDSKFDKNLYLLISIGSVILLAFIIYNLIFKIHHKAYYDIAGFISTICWLTFALPQILQNYRNQSAQGLSTKFVVLAVISSSLDVVSAYALNWALPSKLGAPLGLIQKLCLLSQCYYYRKNKNLLTGEAMYS